LHGEIKILGVGKGRVSQPLWPMRWWIFSAASKTWRKERFKGFEQNGKRFFLNYFKAILALFPTAWTGRNIVLKTGAALRSFIRLSPDVMSRSKELKMIPSTILVSRGDQTWGDRIGEGRFETEGECGGNWQEGLGGQ